MLTVNSLLDTLWHRADYTPMTTTGVNDLNQPVPALGTQVSGIHCRLREANSRDIAEAQVFGIQRVDYVMTVPAELGVAAKGQFKNITDSFSQSIHSGKLTVEHVTTRKLLDQPFFSLCYCMKVKS